MIQSTISTVYPGQVRFIQLLIPFIMDSGSYSEQDATKIHGIDIFNGPFFSLTVQYVFATREWLPA